MAGSILEPGQIEAAAGKPPFIRLPETDLFLKRAERLRDLAQQHPLQAYLQLMADLATAQQAALDNKVAGHGPSADERARSIQHVMPPLPFETLARSDDWLPVVDTLLNELGTTGNPAVEQAVASLREADSGQRKGWAVALLSGQFDLLPAGVVPFLGAALQVAFSQWLLTIDAGAIKEHDTPVCPACGSPPVSGIIEHRGQLNGLRFLHCSLCSCQWHFVRIKCTHCEESKRLRYISLEEDDTPAEKRLIRAEACPNCESYFKQFYLEFDEHAEPVADDLASLALDIRLSEEGYMRRAPNLLLAPGSDE